MGKLSLLLGLKISSTVHSLNTRNFKELIFLLHVGRVQVKIWGLNNLDDYNIILLVHDIQVTLLKPYGNTNIKMPCARFAIKLSLKKAFPTTKRTKMSEKKAKKQKKRSQKSRLRHVNWPFIPKQYSLTRKCNMNKTELTATRTGSAKNGSVIMPRKTHRRWLNAMNNDG